MALEPLVVEYALKLPAVATLEPQRMHDYSRDNPFYDNYLFSAVDLKRATIKWYQYPFLFFLRTYIQIADGFVFHFKTFRGRYYLVKAVKSKIT